MLRNVIDVEDLTVALDLNVGFLVCESNKWLPEQSIQSSLLKQLLIKLLGFFYGNCLEYQWVEWKRNWRGDELTE